MRQARAKSSAVTGAVDLWTEFTIRDDGLVKDVKKSGVVVLSGHMNPKRVK